jgi:hypothetical protein
MCPRVITDETVEDWECGGVFCCLRSSSPHGPMVALGLSWSIKFAAISLE